MQVFSRVLIAAGFAVLLGGCAVKPSKKVAHGEDRNLFDKSELLNRPLTEVSTETTLEAGRSRSVAALPEALKPFIDGVDLQGAEEVSFDIGESYLTINAGKAGKSLPVAQFHIKGHYDLKPQTDAEGVENQYLVKDESVHARWQERAYLESDPTDVLRIKGDDEDVKNLYVVSALQGLSLTFKSEADLTWLTPADRTDLVQFFGLKAGDKLELTLTRRNLDLFRVEADGSRTILAQAPASYVDLVQKNTDKGEPTPLLIKDKTQGDWSRRAFVEVDPEDFQLAKPTADLMKHLYAKASLAGKTFKWGQDQAIPLLSDGKDTAALLAKTAAGAVRPGEQLELRITEKAVDVYASGRLVLKYPVLGHYDVLPSKDSDNLVTAVLERNDVDNPWSKRLYVLVDPDDTETVELSQDLVDAKQQILTKAGLDGQCFAAGALPSDEIAKAVGPVSGQVCFEISQTVLSVYSQASGAKTLLLTYDILSQFDIGHEKSLDGLETAAPLSPNKTNPHWEERAYIAIEVSAPHPAEDHTEPRAVSKSAFDGEFLYTATVTDANSENGLIFPGSQLQAPDRLRFAFDGKTLTAYKVHETLNETGAHSPVLRYSVEHFDVERVKNSYGDRTNVLAETQDRPWDQRSMVRVAFADNQIPTYFNDLLGFEKLYQGIVLSASGSVVGPVEVKDDMISFETEEVMTPNAVSGFLGSDENILEPMAIKIRHVFLKVGARKYEAKNYDDLDFAKFGYFDTTEHGLDPVYGKTDATLKHYMRRYDIAGGKHIDYYLSANFPEKYRPVARSIVAAWNQAFKASVGRDDVMVLHEDVSPDAADPRYNMLVFISDRNDAGLLGYGPSFFDPVSGENLTSKTYLYGDGIQYVLNMASDYYDLAKGTRTVQDFSTATSPSGSVGAPALTAGSLGRPGTGSLLQAGTLGSLLPRSQAAAAAVAARSKGARTDLAAILDRVKLQTQLAPEALAQEAATALPASAKPSTAAQQSLVSHFEGCLMQPEATLASAVKFIDAYPDKTKAELLAELENRVVFTTLLHEVGHNLGLRHNFKGSFDEANFPDLYHQLKAVQAKGGKQPSATPGEWLYKYRTASVMDYNDDFEALYESAGPYDVAAIKFGYGDKLEQVVGRNSYGAFKTKDLPVSEFARVKAEIAAAKPDLRANALDAATKAQLNIRPYQFCTDENTEEDPTCNRFDSGTTVKEVIENLASDYETGYQLYSFRRGRRTFTGSSAGVLTRYVMPVRHLLDEYVYNIINKSFPNQDAEDGSSLPGSPGDYIDAINVGTAFYQKILNTLEPGVYHLDAATGEMVSGRDAAPNAKNLVIDLTEGKYLLQNFEQVGNDVRVQNRGIEFDKIAVLYAMSLRGYPADKYIRAQLAVNYFDLLKEFTLGVYSSIVRDDLKLNVTAVRDAVTGDFRQVDDLGEPFDAANVNQLRATIKPSSSLAIKEYAAIFASTDADSPGERTFGNYLDVRVDGFDATFPPAAQTVQFTSVSGLKTYVVANTSDGLSISYKIATKAAAAQKKLVDVRLALAGIPDGAAQKGEVVKLFGDAWAIGQGEAMPAEIVQELTDHFNDHLADIKGLLAQWLSDQQDSAKKDQLAAIQAKVAPLLAAIEQQAAQATVVTDQISDLEREITQAESDLIFLKGMYTAFN